MLREVKIKSKQPYYVTSRGVVLSSKGNVIRGRNVKGLPHLTYRDKDNKEKSISFPRLVYKTFAKEDLSEGCLILLKNKKLRNKFSFSNLKVSKRKELPEYSSIKGVTKKNFYIGYKKKEMERLRRNLETLSVRELSRIYDISRYMAAKTIKKHLKNGI